MSNLKRAYKGKAGKISNFTLREEALPGPQPTEVQVAVKSIGLNFADLFAIWGLYSATPKNEFIPGLEYAGIIRSVGSEVSGIIVGDKVMGITRFGAYANALNIDSRYVVPLPSGWSFAEGAAFLVQVLTAYYALFNLGNLERDQTVLIHSGAGGVGIFANRFAKSIGAFTIGSTGSAAKISFMQSEGYDQVIVRSRGFKRDLSDVLEGRQLNLIMECIGGKILMQGFDLLAPEGRMVVYGSAQYASKGDRPNYPRLIWKYLNRPKIDPLELPNKNKSLLGFNLIWLYEEVQKMHELLIRIKQHDIGKPYVGQTFEFDQLPQAIKLFQTGHTKGKVVVMVE